MRVIVTGGSGLIGRALVDSLAQDGHEVIVLSRNPDSVKNLPKGACAEKWDGKTAQGWGKFVNGADAIVNLAGATISEKWTEARKREIRESRRAEAARGGAVIGGGILRAQPLTNKEFTHAIGKVLGRPTFMPVPAFVMKTMFGKMVTLLLDGQRQMPMRLVKEGFKFKFTNAEAALRDVLK